MLRYFRRDRPVPFDLDSIGNRWDHLRVPDTSPPEFVSLRLLPPDFVRSTYPFIAAIVAGDAHTQETVDALTVELQDAFEHDAQALLLVRHEWPWGPRWLAAAATRAALAGPLARLAGQRPLLSWDIHEDGRWASYDHATTGH
jgi:hypothetical protein